MSSPDSPLLRFRLWRAGLPAALRLLLTVNVVTYLAWVVASIVGLQEPLMDSLALQASLVARRPWTVLTYAVSSVGPQFGGFFGLISFLFAILWLSVYSPADPETTRFGVFPVPGRARLLLEILLIIAGGSALWMVWSRAAGETFLTAAFIDFVVRYPRLIALYRSR